MAAEGDETRAWRERPILPDHLIFLMTAFHDLSASRNGGMGVMPIPISEIYAYCQMFGIEEYDDRADFLGLIRALDNVFMSEQEKKR